MATSDRDGFDPAAVLDRIETATAHLLSTAGRLTDRDVRAPSLLPGWTRGHVLTHLARNADGGRNLLIWARTTVETPEYPSMAARAEQIEIGADRPAAELLTDVRRSAAGFAAEYRRMPPEAWDRLLRWTAGQERRAARAADSRLCEVLVHHVDLNAGFVPAHWPADFVRDMLNRVVTSLNSREDCPTMRLHAADTGITYDIGPARRSPCIRGPQYALLAWLMGRTGGADLAIEGESALPVPPFLY
jgi:maleylpyruvate isomerase